MILGLERLGWLEMALRKFIPAVYVWWKTLILEFSRPRPKPAKTIPDDLAPPPRVSNRARALLPNTQSYEVAPKSTATQGNNKFAKPVGAAGDEFIRRMKAKKAAQKTGRAY